jgi:hypothetical protein
MLVFDIDIVENEFKTKLFIIFKTILQQTRILFIRFDSKYIGKPYIHRKAHAESIILFTSNQQYIFQILSIFYEEKIIKPPFVVVRYFI